MTMAPRILRYLDPEDLTTGAGALLLSTLAEIQQRQASINLCVSGGPVLMSVMSHFAALANTHQFDSSKLHLWWASERFVPTTSPARNSVLTLSVLAGAISLVPSQIHAMPFQTGQDDPDDAAYTYAEEIGDTIFDICLLEMGEDGHIAALFPDHPSYNVQANTNRQVIGVTDAPLDPPERMSLTLQAMNRSKQVWLLASGEDKQEALAGALRHESRFPAGQVNGSDWTLWFADQDAAGELPYFHCDL